MKARELKSFGCCRVLLGKKWALGIAALFVGLTGAVDAFADNTGYDTVKQMKVFATHADIVLDNEAQSCGGTASHFRVLPEDSEMIRLATAAWLAGKAVSLQYSCDTKNGMTTAWVSGVRAR